eukprot:GILJ01006023.1.p1 GENE.GILJ01006023.1~~GILJ01006023.1.p1  ORF type:complete len:648 (-),score=94.29 GILJ01006023.1:136-2079(-)
MAEIFHRRTSDVDPVSKAPRFHDSTSSLIPGDDTTPEPLVTRRSMIMDKPEDTYKHNWGSLLDFIGPPEHPVDVHKTIMHFYEVLKRDDPTSHSHPRTPSIDVAPPPPLGSQTARPAARVFAERDRRGCQTDRSGLTLPTVASPLHGPSRRRLIPAPPSRHDATDITSRGKGTPRGRLNTGDKKEKLSTKTPSPAPASPPSHARSIAQKLQLSLSDNMESSRRGKFFETDPKEKEEVNVLKLGSRHHLLRAQQMVPDEAETDALRNQTPAYIRLSEQLGKIRSKYQSPAKRTMHILSSLASHEDSDLYDIEALLTNPQYYQKIRTFITAKWLKKRNPNSDPYEAQKTDQFLKHLFFIFDQDGSGLVSVEELVPHFLAMGVAEDKQSVMRLMELIMGSYNKEMSIDEFQTFFKSDSVEAAVIGMLHRAKKAQQDQGVDVSSNQELISKWWRALDSNMTGRVLIRDVETFFVSAGLIDSRSDIKRSIHSVKKGKDLSMITFDEFHKMFARGIVHDAFLKIGKTIKQKEYGDTRMPVSLKLTAYQRKLLLGGLLGDDNLGRDGKNVMKSLERMRRGSRGTNMLEADSQDFITLVSKLRASSTGTPSDRRAFHKSRTPFWPTKTTQMTIDDPRGTGKQADAMRKFFNHSSA